MHRFAVSSIYPLAVFFTLVAALFSSAWLNEQHARPYVLGADAVKFRDEWTCSGGDMSGSGYVPGKLEGNYLGKIAWEQVISGVQLEPTVVVSGGNAIFWTATEDKQGVIAIDLKSGKQSWTRHSRALSLHGAIGSRVFVHDSTPGGLVCLDAKNGKEVWSQKEMPSDLRLTDDGFFSASNQGSQLYEYKKGAPKWKDGGRAFPALQRVFVDKNYAYVVDKLQSNPKVAACDLKKGAVDWSWTSDIDGEQIIHVEDGIVFTCGKGKIRRIEGKTGKVLAEGAGHLGRTPPKRGSDAATGEFAFTNDTIYAVRGQLVMEFDKTDLHVRHVGFLAENGVGQPTVTDDSVIVGTARRTFVLRRRDLCILQKVEVGGATLLAGSTLICVARYDRAQDSAPRRGKKDTKSYRLSALAIEAGPSPAMTETKAPTRPSWDPSLQPCPGDWSQGIGSASGINYARGKLQKRRIERGWTFQTGGQVDDLPEPAPKKKEGGDEPEYPADPSFEAISAYAVTANAFLYIGVGERDLNRLVALDAETGTVLWALSLPTESKNTMLFAANGRVFVLGRYGPDVGACDVLYCVDVTSGRVINAIPTAMGDACESYFDGSTVYISNGKSVAAIDAAAARLEGRFDVFREHGDFLAVDATVVYMTAGAAQNKNQIVAWDLKASKELWSYTFKKTFRSGGDKGSSSRCVVRIGDEVLVVGECQIAALDAKTGAEKWTAVPGQTDGIDPEPSQSLWREFAISPQRAAYLVPAQFIAASAKDGSQAKQLEATLKKLVTGFMSDQVLQIALLDDAVVITCSTQGVVVEDSGNVIAPVEVGGRVALGAGALFVVQPPRYQDGKRVQPAITRYSLK